VTPRWSPDAPAGPTPAALAKEEPALRPHRLPTRRARIAVLATTAAVLAGMVLFAGPAAAATPSAPSLNSVIDALRLWLVGILAGLATLFLTIGGIRYLTAGGDPAEVERAKIALKSAAIGFALAALAPLLVSILQSVVGG
jgi:hypothetical protein